MQNYLTFINSPQFADKQSALPMPADSRAVAVGLETWLAVKSSNNNDKLAYAIGNAAASAAGQRWLDSIFGNSPFLTQLALRDPAIVIDVMTDGPDHTFAQVLERLNADHSDTMRTELMANLRHAKRHAALIVAMADLAGLWPLVQVTGALSRLAEAALKRAMRFILRSAASSGEIKLADPADPELGCGVIVLGMGKLGAHELNYSSDIDVIILFDADLITYTGRDSLQSAMTKLTRELVAIMEQRTAEGYVFRTDLRLRPDPGSTPPAVSVAMAENYYGSLGQNWERAAMIKARPVAGDIAAGEAFLKVLTPFVWRKHLDFAAIRDIHSIKRQIEARHNQAITDISGYNVKLGHGGIREIEFFAQTQQLIWGGRIPALRLRGTVETLLALVEAGRIEAGPVQDLIAAYRYLRTVEHRLQMVNDQQTHSLPNDSDGLRRFAVFMGNETASEFSARLTATLTRVRTHFSELFSEDPQLSSDGNLVFTGTESDPETLATLTRLGFKDPEAVAAAVRGWHHGRFRATRSERARELLTELGPQILKSLGMAAAPDFAFRHFDRFLGQLPAGVQIFSLFRAKPELLNFLALIMGEAPGLAAGLSRNPALLDSVLTGGFFTPLSTASTTYREALLDELASYLSRARDFEDMLDLTRRWNNEQRFRVGAHLLLGHIDGEAAGTLFSAIAETVVRTLLPRVSDYVETSHGAVPGGRFAVVALGKLGSREMTALSDLDLSFVYDAPADAEGSDGPKPLPVSTYYARLGQRLINALTAPTAEGKLYEVDMRLRPSGNAGPLASSLAAFKRYHAESAWTWEHMALTRARVLAGDQSLANDVEGTIVAILSKPRDPEKLLADVADMRERIAKSHPHPKTWDAKHRRGGLVDIEFIAQYLQLRHAAERPDILVVSTAEALERVAAAGFLDPHISSELRFALRLWHQIQGMQRVIFETGRAEETEGALLERALARGTGIADPVERSERIEATAATAYRHFVSLIGEPKVVSK